jgi:hypothetical protein
MLEIQLNLKTPVAKIFVLVFILNSTECGIGLSFGTRQNLNLKDMTTSVVTTAVIIVFILLRRVIIVNTVIWIIPLPLLKQMINKLKKMKVMFHK